MAKRPGDYEIATTTNVTNQVVSKYQKMLVTNPACPLAFELTNSFTQPGVDSPSTTIAGAASIFKDAYGPDLQNMNFDEAWVDRFKSPAVACAAKMALEAYKVREPEMIREVFATCMRISDGVCPEAYNLLALRTARNHEEALMLYLKAEELAPMVCDDFDMLCREGRLSQEAPQLHSYIRALHGAANCYRKMHRLEESLEMYQILLRVDTDWNDQGDHVNFRAQIPEVIMALGDWEVTCISYCT